MYFQCNNGLVHIARLEDQQAYYYCSAFARHVSNCTLSKAKSKVQAGRWYSCSDYSTHLPCLWSIGCQTVGSPQEMQHFSMYWADTILHVTLLILSCSCLRVLMIWQWKHSSYETLFFTAVWEVWSEELILGLHFLACFTLKFSSTIVAHWMSYSVKLLFKCALTFYYR